MTMQLTDKHRYHDHRDSLLLEQIELDRGFPHLMGVAPPARRGRRRGTRRPAGNACAAVRRMSSYQLWMIGQATFLVVSVLVLVVAIAGNAAVWLSPDPATS